MISIPDARIPDARREDGLNMDLSKILNYPLLLQLTSGNIYLALGTQGQRSIRLEELRRPREKPRVAESGIMTYDSKLCSYI